MSTIEHLHSTLIKISFGNVKIQNKICAFDLDGTLVKTKYDKRFPVDSNDWEFLLPSIPERLKQLYESDFQLYIITNQAGIKMQKQSERDVTDRICNILTAIGVPITVYIPTAKDYWRKPNTSIFEKYILQNRTDPPEILYVGDAAGRKGDFADTDRKFAYNLYLLMKYLYPGLPKSKHPGFRTETEFFNPNKPQHEAKHWRGFDPAEYLKTTTNSNELTLPPEPFMIIMIGPPGSGKSTVANMLKNNKTVVINRDSLGTIPKCITMAKQAISSKQNIIIDNTNPTNDDRKKFTDLTINTSYNVRYFEMLTGIELSKHMSQVRERKSQEHHRIPDVVYNTFVKKYEPPPQDKTVKINFVPKFATKKDLLWFLQKDE